MTKGKYDDMLSLPHHVSKKHPPMTILNRAAQFAPFAALTGFEDDIAEEARLTDAKEEGDAWRAAVADRKLAYLAAHESDRLHLSVRYFVNDEKKAGGSYRVKEGNYKRLDENERMIYFTDGSSVSLDAISDIEVEDFSGE